DGRIVPAETEYKVIKGDNLGKMARQFGVSVSDLRSWNKLKNDNLRIGQVLIVSGYAAGASKGASSAPAKAAEKKESKKEEPKAETKTESKSESKPAEKQAEFITYKVKKGDTLFGIAREHGCSVDDLKSWNNLSSNALSIGQKLKIRK
ncbi:MAG: LysM peptidoglycan-binding domain-containing protein, partial [Bacteroidota bacterium]|nr:LysM peptidoglycan-binding domain-containing protein [Bacteroidota bacterium]